VAKSHAHTPGCVEAAYASIFFYSICALIWDLAKWVELVCHKWHDMTDDEHYLEGAICASIFVSIFQFSRIYSELHELDHVSKSKFHGFTVARRFLLSAAAVLVIVTVEELGESRIEGHLESHTADYSSLCVFAVWLLATCLLLMSYDAFNPRFKKKRVVRYRRPQFWQRSAGVFFSITLLLFLNYPNDRFLGAIALVAVFGVAGSAIWGYIEERKLPLKEIFSPLGTIFSAILGHKLFSRIEEKIPQIPRALPLTAIACAVACYFVIGNISAEKSYDFLQILTFFGGDSTNGVVVVEMHDRAGETPVGTNILRDSDLALLKRLNRDKPRLIVFDELFSADHKSTNDTNLAGEIRAGGNVVLLQLLETNKGEIRILEPQELIGSGALDTGIGAVETPNRARRHWPFPSPGPYPSLPEAAAKQYVDMDACAKLKNYDFGDDEFRWLRYYSENENKVEFAGLRIIDYSDATNAPNGVFHDKVVFIGEAAYPEKTNDVTHAPWPVWGGAKVGGVRILATTHLNLINGDWLRKWPGWLELFWLLVISSLTSSLTFLSLSVLPELGKTFPSPKVFIFAVLSLCIATILIVAVFRYRSNHWFNWLLMILQLLIACGLAVRFHKSAPKMFPRAHRT
jgi:CHASE2 domain-containing sensor protein